MPDTGAPIPANRPSIMTRYPPEPVDSFRQFSENWGTNMTPIITKPLTVDSTSVTRMFLSVKYLRLITGSSARFSMKMNTGIRAAKTSR